MKKADRIYYNPIGLYALNLMLCSVFALLPYEHKPNVYWSLSYAAIITCL